MSARKRQHVEYQGAACVTVLLTHHFLRLAGWAPLAATDSVEAGTAVAAAAMVAALAGGGGTGAEVNMPRSRSHAFSTLALHTEKHTLSNTRALTI